MKIGIFDHLDRRDQPLNKFYDERIQFAQACEAAGIYSYHIAEHHGTPLGMAPSPNLWLAGLARETKTLRFGPMVYLFPLYPPVRLIEEICMLDNMSNGRLDVGVGRGVSPWEVACYGLEPKDTRPMLEEGLDLVLAGLTNKHLNHAGKYYKVADLPLEMQPMQKPYPPLWYGAATVDSARYAARYGMHFTTLGSNERVKPLLAAYGKLWEETRNEPERARSPVKQPLIGLGRHFVLADTNEEAERLAKSAYAYWWQSVTSLWRLHNAAPMTGMLIPTYEEARAGGQVICGTAERVRNETLAQAKDMPFNYLLGQFAFGNLSHAQEMKSFGLFARDVMPALAKL